ncbi:unnamed protein product [Diabrotica balteata]|uniref:Defensin n=1 Tax=Diabrotica balteata TaxID=107213 RepID=A0A9N9T6Q4_DIABA|nr:unnamed protein product [Diabrotica balteata]
MKYLLVFLVFFVVATVALAGSGCNVVPCSDYCQSVGHFGGYCVGPTLDTCHCYDVGHKN